MGYENDENLTVNCNKKSHNCNCCLFVNMIDFFSDYRIKGSMTDMIEPDKNEVQKSKLVFNT